MNSFMDAKLMAKLLRQGLADRGVELGHSACLELVARQFGVAEWNILSAQIEAANTNTLVMPDAWHLSGDGHERYRAGLDPDQPGTALIHSRSELDGQIGPENFCTMMQSVDASNYRGQRLRLRARIRSESADGVTIWLRVDGSQGLLRFDNLERDPSSGPLSGTSDWCERSIVLEVPDNAVSLNYGFYLKGQGRAWAREFSLDPVDASTPLNPHPIGPLSAPTNLGFTALH